MKWNHL